MVRVIAEHTLTHHHLHLLLYTLYTAVYFLRTASVSLARGSRLERDGASIKSGRDWSLDRASGGIVCLQVLILLVEYDKDAKSLGGADKS